MSRAYRTREQWRALIAEFEMPGNSSEGLPGQGDLFNEIEDILQPDEEEVAAEQHIAIKRQLR